ncbi:MAG: gliding motility-associated C-terminal domain-containing protein [Flavobacteriales bacterium]
MDKVIKVILLTNNERLISEIEEVGADSNSIVSWSWGFGDGMFGEEQLTDHTYSDEGIFTVSVLVENEFGCFSTDTALVEVTQIITIPNVFTPNDDGYNDQLYFDNYGADAYELTIYNRWGMVVHYDKSGEIFWDGRTPAGAECEAGTYFYKLNVKNEFSLGDFKQTGYVTLIR